MARKRLSKVKAGEEFFMFNGRKHNYFHAPGTHHTERRMEISLGLPFLLRHRKNVLEVGNVIRSHRPRFQHHTIDLFEKHPGWKNYENKDVLTYEPKPGLQGVLSLSTLEHTEDPAAAIRRVLAWAPNVLISIPLGYRCKCRVLTNDVLADHDWSDVDVHIMQRITKDNKWKQITREEYDRLPPDVVRYGKQFPFANVVAIWLKGRL